MKNIIVNLGTVFELLIGNFTLIKIENKQLIVMPKNLSKDEVRQVATEFFREAYNLQ